MHFLLMAFFGYLRSKTQAHHTSADDIPAQQIKALLQSHPRISGRRPYVFLLAILFLAALSPTALAGIVQGSVKLIPSGVLQMTAEWTDSPKTGAMLVLSLSLFLRITHTRTHLLSLSAQVLRGVWCENVFITHN